MTFKHKLAHRLALLRGRSTLLAPLALLLLTTCEKAIPVGIGNVADAVSARLSPKNATLTPGQTTEFVLVAFTSTGDTDRQAQVTWSVTGGSMISTNTNGGQHLGWYKSGSQPGSYKVTGTATPGGASDSTAITVASPVASVSVSPTTAAVQVGQTTQLAATARDASGNPLPGDTITWTSWNAPVATVSASGLVTGVAVGTATISAASGGQSGTATITVTQVPVAAVAVSPATANLTAGQTAQLSATPKDASGNPLTGRVITWATSNAAVATVSAGGLVTAVAAGSATITATSEGQSGTAAVTVSVVPVASVSVSPATASLTVGQTAQLAATPKDASGNPLTGRVITWATSNAAVATVSTSGLVTAVAAGSATITATSGGQSGTATITVTQVPVASVAVSPASVTVLVGQTAQLTATPKDASGNPLTGRVITWATSNAAVATVSTSGLVTAVAAGSATITATSEGQSGTAAVTVSVVPVASVGVSPATASLTVGQTSQLTATPKDASGNPLTGRVITWATSNAAVATVNASGLVTAVLAGSATITATSEGQSGTAAVTVTVVPVASVTVSPATASLTVGQTAQLTATPKDASGNPLTGRVITWATSNAAVATVSTSGLVTAVLAGSATITATSEGQSGTAAVTVTVVPVASVTVSPATASLTVGQTTQLTATPKDASGNPLTGRLITWATSNAAVATVSTSGLVTAVAAGSATITATCEGQSATATATVTTTVSSFGNIYEFGFEDGTIGQFNILPGAPATYQVISSDFALGSHSILIDYPANQADEGVGLQYSGSNFNGKTYNDIWCRFAMKQLLSVAAQDKKIIRFSGSTPSSPTFAWSMIYDPSNDYYTSWFETFAGTHGLVPMTNGPKMSQILGQWHWWEVHLALNYNSAPVHVDVYFDGTLIYSQDASAAAGYSGTNTQISTWNYIEMDGTLNGGPNAHEQTGFDQIGISTVRMGIPVTTSNP